MMCVTSSSGSSPKKRPRASNALVRVRVIIVQAISGGGASMCAVVVGGGGGGARLRPATAWILSAAFLARLFGSRRHLHVHVHVVLLSMVVGVVPQ